MDPPERGTERGTERDPEHSLEQETCQATGRRAPEWRRPPEGYLGSAQDGSTFWLLSGHVYCQKEDTMRWLCPLASFNRLSREAPPPLSPTD